MDRKRNQLKLHLLLSLIALSLFSCNAARDSDIITIKTDSHNILLAYFSRADENYSVGYVEKGNTEVIADYISESITCDLTFKIERAEDYPTDYDSCTKEAEKEKNSESRPRLKKYIDESEFSKYDVVFLGYPIWYGTMPMPVYTFIESYQWTDKIVYPFSTNEGSGFGNTISVLKDKLTGAKLMDGYSARGHEARSKENEVKDWISNTGLGDK